jgi:protein O-GlcNAc transferase
MAVSIFQNPDSAPTLNEKRSVLNDFQTGNYESAIQQSEGLISKYPKNRIGPEILAAIYRARQEHAKALPYMQRVVDLHPKDAKAHFNLANTLRDLGQSEEAAKHYRLALKIDPDLPNGFYHLGNMQHEIGQVDLAESSFRKALSKSPEHIESLNNLGHLLQDRGRFDEAKAIYDKALEISPGHEGITFNRIELLSEMGCVAEALEASRQLLSKSPEFANALTQRGHILLDSGDIASAMDAFKAAVDADPNSMTCRSSYLFNACYAPSGNAQEMVRCAMEFGNACQNLVQAINQPWTGAMETSILRVGFVSADLRNHPVGYFLESVLSQLKSNRIELVALPTNPYQDELTSRIRPFFSQWHAIGHMSDQDAAAYVRRLGLHIVIDLSGHTVGNRLPLFTYRLAPLQISWLGYFATTGVKEIDYLIADPHCLPKQIESHFTEKIWRLPHTRLCFTAPSAKVKVGPLPALANGHITFGSTSNLLKLNDRVIALWSQILQQVPGSKLLLQAKQLGAEKVRAQLVERFAANGISSERLVIVGPAKREQYFHTYDQIDFCLDPFPYPGGTTTAESLWMGVPVLTMDGETLLSKQGVSIHRNVGLDNWVALDERDYIAKAVAHAGDVGSLAELRKALRAQVLASPLYDAKSFAQQFEQALWAMWDEKKSAPGFD